MNTSQQTPRGASAFSVLVVALMLVMTLSNDGLAARKASNGPSGVPTNSPAPAGESRQQRPVAKPLRPARVVPSEGSMGFGVRQKKSASAASPSLERTSRRSMKVLRKPAVKAVVRPRTDLIPYGMLEDAQRYDPRPRAVSAGVPTPQRLDLTHDHFQELDRNQDGKIDPVERALGRIDMDRDLDSRTLR